MVYTVPSVFHTPHPHTPRNIHTRERLFAVSCCTVTSWLSSVTQTLASFHSALQKFSTSCCLATSVYINKVKECPARRGNAKRCTGDPRSLTGRYGCIWRLNLWGSTYTKTTQALQKTKHIDAHIQAPPHRHWAITALSVCHLISSGRAAALGNSCYWKCGVFLNSQSNWTTRLLKPLHH